MFYGHCVNSSEQFMGHRGLEIQEGDLGPLLAPDVVEELQQTYLSTLRKNIAEWMSNSLSTDKKVPTLIDLIRYKFGLLHNRNDDITISNGDITISSYYCSK